MKRPEQAIHKAVVAHLNTRGVADMFWFHVPNGGKRGIIEASIFKKLGVIAGVPDIILIHQGETFGLELKADKGTLKPSQRLALARMQNAGAKVAVAHSLDEALITLECWGVLKRSVENRVPAASQGPQGA